MDVTEAKYLNGYRLDLTFSDGTRGVADMEEEIRSFSPFKPLQDIALFHRGFIQDGTMSWPGHIDIAVEWLYALAHLFPAPATQEAAKANELEVSLRELRKLSDVNQTALAETLAITQSAISRLEAAAADAKLSTPRRFVGALGWDLEVVAVKGDRRLRLRGI